VIEARKRVECYGEKSLGGTSERNATQISGSGPNPSGAALGPRRRIRALCQAISMKRLVKSQGRQITWSGGITRCGSGWVSSCGNLCRSRSLGSCMWLGCGCSFIGTTWRSQKTFSINPLHTGQARVREYVRDGILQSRRHGRRILILGISIARYLGITLDENGKENTREELSRT
jgi:hypothetical protein